MALILKRFPVYCTNRSPTQIRSKFDEFPVASSSQIFTILNRNYVSSRNKEDFSKYFAILEIPPNSDQECVRQAFLKLVKRFHPDSGSPEADETKFNLIETAYRKLQTKFSNERWKVNEGAGEYGLYYQEKQDDIKEFDIKHTAPQHRQYLSYGGFGIGTPQQREKQFQKHRAQKAIDNIHNHRVSNIAQENEDSLVLKDKREAQKIKLRSEMDRLVEDLIQESMQRGDFDNLAGKGKPLKHQASNPYVDFVTHKMNQVLIDNGFTPEWITLQKEILKDSEHLRDSLSRYRAELGELPLKEEEAAQWCEVVKEHEDFVKKINGKIDKFNLLVPILDNQKVHLRLKQEAERILKTVKANTRKKDMKGNGAKGREDSDLLSFFTSILSLPK